ncbi:MAG TPA: 3-deoxy-7-phosphoheptulonate synthase [Streptosporangiaceae bacterium]|nr:3-deoxy-7-phosphoheptulonate synthase [Streptosporangiaceae bacterium]
MSPPPARVGGDGPDAASALTEHQVRAVRAALERPAAQQPAWPDRRRALTVRATLAREPPVVTAGEVDRLSARLEAVCRGQALLVQGGECAETFALTAGQVVGSLRVLCAMTAVVERGTAMPVVMIGRLGGQYAKPRSALLDAEGLPSYRGDMVHSAAGNRAARVPDPARMITAHARARSTIGLLRAFCRSQPADRPQRRAAAAGGAFGLHGAAEIFASHEALVLDYEYGLLRSVAAGLGPPRLYDLSSHFLWIGDRTRQPAGAHVQFAALLANPIGLKIGPGARPEEVADCAERLNPDRVPGRLTLICRLGHDRVRDLLPPIIEKLLASEQVAIWQCDPMHANTRRSRNGYKTRYVDDMTDEVNGYVAVHRALGTHPGGLHLELTGEDVTECIGGLAGVTEDDLPRRYRTACDPRLNRQQALEVASVFAAALGPGR